MKRACKEVRFSFNCSLPNLTLRRQHLSGPAQNQRLGGNPWAAPLRCLRFLILCLLVGCAASQPTQRNDAHHAIEFCVWTVLDAYGDLEAGTMERVEATCMGDYARWRLEVTNGG